ncbi:MAG: hypothetical protein MRERV_12c016 [Mycoplasmataceae bacterium RV_VA103A]|nr:MAG: hypothetical protein MRERV_12c016 [Mycoplasmataceae bacterium RV_VA103A]
MAIQIAIPLVAKIASWVGIAYFGKKLLTGEKNENQEMLSRYNELVNKINQGQQKSIDTAAYQKELDNLTAKLNKKNKEGKKRQKKLEEALEQSKLDYQEALKKSDTKRQKQLEEQHKKHQAELAEMMKTYEANAQAALKESENSLKAEIKALNKQLEEAKAEKTKLEEKIVEIEKLRKEQEETVAKCEKQREELDQLKEQNKISTEEYQNRLNIIEDDRKKAQQDLDQTMASLGAYKRQLDEQKEKEKNLNEEIKKGQEGLISLKDKLGETSQKLNDLANKYNVNVSVPDFSSYHGSFKNRKPFERDWDTDSESDIEPPKVPLQNNQDLLTGIGSGGFWSKYGVYVKWGGIVLAGVLGIMLIIKLIQRIIGSISKGF